MSVLKILKMMDAGQQVYIKFYAYGIILCDSDDCGQTVAECLANMNYDCLHAKAVNMRVDNNYIVINATLN